jgi:hypothetical protein
MRGDLVYQRVTDGRVIEVLRDELGRNFVALMSRWHVWGTILPYNTAEVVVVQQMREERRQSSRCAVFENLRRKSLIDEYKVWRH